MNTSKNNFMEEDKTKKDVYEEISKFEKKHVVDVYDKIANHFNHTRCHIWPGVKTYYDTLKKGSLIADIGCGNGRNMCKDFKFIGMDLSKEQCKIAQEKTGNSVVLGKITDIPFNDNIFDHAICIAVIHHLREKEDRLKAIKELLRIIKVGGTIMISVWEFDKDSPKRNKKDKMVRWTLNKKYSKEKETIILERYYYMFDKTELEKLVKKCDNAEIIRIYHECDNTYGIIKKI